MLRGLILVRHGEALKNVEGRHGGDGTSLTERGRLQADMFASVCTRYFGPVRVLVQPKPQCLETAEIVCGRLGVRHEVLRDVAAFKLGVLDGLSEIEAKVRYPDVAEAMDAWRRGFIEIGELQIPGATDPFDFLESGRRLLRSLDVQDGVTVAIATRSVLVLLWNLLRGRTCERGGGYFERPWGNLEWIEFLRRREDGGWIENRTQRPTLHPTA